MVNSFCKRVSSSIPRILNWSNTIVTKNPTLRDLKDKKHASCDEERQQLQLDGLFLDESIDERGVAKQSFEGGSSSKKSDSADIDWMKSKLEMLSSNQSSLAEDFILLRCFVDFNFKSVMTVIKDIQEKVNAIHRRPSDEGKSSDELVTQDSDDDPDDDDDDDDDAEDDEKQLPDPENIDSDSDDGGELVKVGGDADDADKDVEKPKGDESRLKGDDFFDGLSQLVIDDDQVVLAGLEAVAKINVPAPNPDVVGEKSDALHTDEETEDTVSDTPLLDKRKRAPALKSPFVDFGSADVGSTPMELMSSGSQSVGDDRDFKMVTYMKGFYALNDAFADPVSTEIEAKFDSWIGEGLLKHPRHYNCYEDGAKKFTPGFRLDVDYVEDKTWFYHLATCDMFMNDSVKFPIYIVLMVVCF
ncbi:protein BFR2-like [Cannabis sativa]|uniref:protein BFR2-like n=1 Tax=Cannabis sativa TaxID=3483 RepID=UPI0029CA0765|nr:protein BFR2-like [Cannabis sativa]